MDNLPFQNEELDLIWSEGAIYNIGFERGMNEWSKYLKKGGFIAVSEASWFTSERPAEIEDFWMDAYPEISVIRHVLTRWKGPDILQQPISSYRRTAGQNIILPHKMKYGRHS